MLQRTELKILWLAVAVSALASWPAFAASSKEPARTLVVSFPHLRLAKGERICGFELTVTAATIDAVARIPVDWSLRLDVESGSQTKLSGTCGHGASALESAQQLPHVTVVLEKAFDRTSPTFGVEATLHVTADFQTTRTVKLTSGGLVIRK